MNNEIIEKIADYYKVDAVELIKHYNTLSTLNEDIRPEPSDILSYLVLALLNKDQLFYGSLGIQVADFIEKLYFSEEAFSTLTISAYDNYGDELHVMEIVDSLFYRENRFANLPTSVWEAHIHRADLLSSFWSGMVRIFGEDGYRVYILFARNSAKLSEFQGSISDLIELYEREFDNKDKTFIFTPISIKDINKSYTTYHKKTTQLYGEVIFKELSRYNGMYCLVYQKEID